MRILLIITGLGLGGAERQVVDLADAFVSCGNDVLIVALTGKVVVQPSSCKVRIQLINMRKTIVGFVSAYMQLRKVISTFRPEVVHSHMVHANLISRLLRLSVYIPRLICTAHSTNEGGELRMWAYRLTDSLADLSTNVSAEAVAAFVAHGAVAPGRMISVSNGIDTDRFALDRFAGEVVRNQMNVDPEVKIILAVGRLTKAKDYPSLLNAYRSLDNSVVRTQLWIVGDGELWHELQNLVSMLSLNDNVRFLGVRHDVQNLMSAADVFVLSSAWEGFGLVVAEAMACECVVVATDCGGVREVLGEIGYLVKPSDSKAIAEALQIALKLPAVQCAALGSAARQRVINNFSLDAAVAKWLLIYEGKVTIS